jgi:nucleoid DNA-binding protein
VKERNGRNPRTGESITIPAGLRVKFTAFQGLKERIKEDNKTGESK